MRTAVYVDSVTKTYGSGDTEVAALRGVTIGFAPGTFTAIMGPSGSGKSTLMQCAAGLDTPTSGTVNVGEQDLSQLDEVGLTVLGDLPAQSSAPESRTLGERQRIVDLMRETGPVRIYSRWRRPRTGQRTYAPHF